MIMAENLIKDASNPELFENYKGIAVAFYDGFKATVVTEEDGSKKTVDKPVLYIHIRILEDRYTVIQRRAKERFVNGQLVHEKTLYRRAYEKYLKVKDAKLENKSGVLEDNLKLKKKIEELEAKVAKESKTKKGSKTKKVEDKENKANIEDTKGVAEPVLTF